MLSQEPNLLQEPIREGLNRLKRQHYNKYRFLSTEVKEIQELIQSPQYGDCAYLTYVHKIPSSTIRTWKVKIEKDPSYDVIKGYKRKRRAIFTEEEESAIADYIRVNIIGVGWTTEEVFIQYLELLSNHFNHEPIHLILDLYAAHRTDAVKQRAEELGITLYFIPPGCTDLVQPLDVKVFGALKATARKLFRERYNGISSPKMTSRDAVQNLIMVWEGLSQNLNEE